MSSFHQKKKQQQQRHFRIWIQLPDRHLNLLNLLKFMFNSATLEVRFLQPIAVTHVF